jgi:branched-chain amino acid transport system ATP-binding protein
LEARSPNSDHDAERVPVLRAQGVDVSYGPIRAVQEVSISVEDGSVTALVGANGAGKSSLLKALVGLVKMSAKELTIRGTDVRRLNTLARVRDLGIVLVPEGRAVFTGMTVDEGLEMGRRIGRYREKAGRVESAVDLDTIFELFPNLYERRHQLGQQLSGGEQQMLAVAKSLLMAPSILLVDEPSVGLAPRIVRAIFETLDTIMKRYNVSILLVEQDSKLALDVADYAYVISHGRVVVEGTAETVRELPELRAAYLGEVPDVPDTGAVTSSADHSAGEP